MSQVSITQQTPVNPHSRMFSLDYHSQGRQLRNRSHRRAMVESFGLNEDNFVIAKNIIINLLHEIVEHYVTNVDLKVIVKKI